MNTTNETIVHAAFNFGSFAKVGVTMHEGLSMDECIALRSSDITMYLLEGSKHWEHVKATQEEALAHLRALQAAESEEEEEEEEAARPQAEIVADILHYFQENEEEYNETIEELDSYMGYLGDDRYYPMDEFRELMEGKDPIDLLNMAYFGSDAEGPKESSFNPNREYFSFNGYGNLVSSDYKDYSAFLDNYFIDALIKYAGNLYLPEEVEDLINEYDEAEQ